ncbi:uncharacterized protein LOC125197311 isoform X3 [Salvia hispanica]|uniref:uncharacterized protein LOC125197311 isoform X3 n=1 Tax=Salvia hispanica TaxID=49212 RepID=UPI002009D1B5|nr:uncharacterized protein LOC125197311 isoform X3 [Salvia hispanica]
MERSQPTLVPEWLKNAGNSTSHSDDHPASKASWNKSSLNGKGHDPGRSSSSERTTSSYFQRSSSSNSSGTFRSNSSFGRSQRDRNWEKGAYGSHDHDDSFMGGRRHRKFSDQLVDPSLGGEKWTSALAEVPMLVGSNGTESSSVLQATSSSSAPVALGSATSLNMAEAVAQGPSRSQTTPQLSVGAQRLEELALKQSRQLIPVTPTMPKVLVLKNSSDKSKGKVGSQQPSISSPLPVNHSPRGGLVKSDVSKTSNVGKLQVLKPVREKNGVGPVVKDNLSPTSGSSVAGFPSVSGSAVSKPPPSYAVPDRKPVLTLLEKRPSSQARSRNDFFNLVRKKSMANPASADSATASTSSELETGSSLSPSLSNKHAEMDVMPATSQPVEVPLSLSLESEEKAGSICNGDAYDVQKCVSNGKKHPSSDRIISEDEEAAFLRSLGWEENNDEEGLTEEEITAFRRDLTKYINSKPSPRILQLVQLLTPFDSQLEGIDEMSSSDDKSEP